MLRRTFLRDAAGALGVACVPRLAWANVPKPYSFDLLPALDSREAYVGWMVSNRGEDPKFLHHHWSRYEALPHNKDLSDTATSVPSCYKGRIVPFVPFTKLEGDAIKGTHNNPK
jgi:hypothetical protein